MADASVVGEQISWVIMIGESVVMSNDDHNGDSMHAVGELYEVHAGYIPWSLTGSPKFIYRVFEIDSSKPPS